jgi:hypothetical protein
MIIKHMYQPTGNTCGPTCLYMVKHYLVNYPNDLPFDVDLKLTIKEIEDMCGTDWIVGTPPDRMVKGMTELKIPHVEHYKSPRPYELLKKILDDGNIAIVRTITRGIPHWIVVHGYEDNNYNVADPASGPLVMTEKQLDAIWSLRQYQFFEILVPEKTETGYVYAPYIPVIEAEPIVIGDFQPKEVIESRYALKEINPNYYRRIMIGEDLKIEQGIPEERQTEVIDWTYPYFQHVTGAEYFYAILRQEANWEKSLLLLNDKNEIKGVYLLGDQPIESLVKTQEYKDLKGVEGVVLAVDSELRGKGWGTKLKDYPKTMGYDYIWGQQLKTLNNLEDWLKRRVLVAETKSVYNTAEKFSK